MHPQDLAIWLREGLVRLGPTFIKIGQQFSTRVDVLAPEFIKELEKLQVGGSWAEGGRAAVLHPSGCAGARVYQGAGETAGSWEDRAICSDHGFNV